MCDYLYKYKCGMRSHSASSTDSPPFHSEIAAVCRQECKVLCVYSLGFYYHSRSNHASTILLSAPFYCFNAVLTRCKMYFSFFLCEKINLYTDWTQRQPSERALKEMNFILKTSLDCFLSLFFFIQRLVNISSINYQSAMSSDLWHLVSVAEAWSCSCLAVSVCMRFRCIPVLKHLNYVFADKTSLN